MTLFTDADRTANPNAHLAQEATIVPLAAAPLMFNPQWRETEHAVLENLRYGSIRHRVVLDPQGRPLFDFPQLLEPGGVAILPLSDSGKAGLISIYRHSVLKEKPTGSYPGFILPDDFGVWMWEAPRGYRDHDEPEMTTPVRELSEETGLHVERIELVGNVITNSAFAPTPIQLFLATVRDESGQPQHEENIRAVRFFDRHELENCIETNQMRCSITLSLLFHAFVRRYIR